MSGPVRYCPACYAVNPYAATACERCGAVLVTEEAYDERLIWALRHPDTETAVLAAELLGARGARRAIGPLLEATRSSDPYRAAAAARALGAFVDEPRVARRLRQLADDGPAIVRRAAAAALAARRVELRSGSAGPTVAPSDRGEPVAGREGDRRLGDRR